MHATGGCVLLPSLLYRTHPVKYKKKHHAAIKEHHQKPLFQMVPNVTIQSTKYNLQDLVILEALQIKATQNENH